MSHADPRAALIAAITDLREETALALVCRRLDTGDDPLLLVKDSQDVPPTTFAEQAAQLLPHVIGLSGVVASVHEAMRETVVLPRAKGYGGPIVIGGGQLSETVCRYVGADYWTIDAVGGVEHCSRLNTGVG